MEFQLQRRLSIAVNKYQKKRAEEGKEVEERLEREKEVSEVTAERERRRCTRISALVGWQLQIG